MKGYVSAAAACAGLALTSCQDGALANEEQPVDVVALLHAGDPTVCAQTEVQELALTISEPAYEKFKADGGEPIGFEAVSATGVNKDIHEVSCSANMMAYSGNLLEGVDIRPVSIRYKVRPALDANADYVVEIVLGGVIKEAVQTHILLSKIAKESANPPAEEQAAAEPEMNTDDIVANDYTPIDGDVPNQIEADVQAIEDAENEIY